MRLFNIGAAWIVGALIVIGSLSGSTLIAQIDQPLPDVAACSIDLSGAGHMSDIISNALTRGLKKPSAAVRKFLDGAETRFPTGGALLTAAAKHFKVDEKRLAAEVEVFRHCNCSHAGGAAIKESSESVEAFELSAFAHDVTLHVVLHEMGHALVREFDLPILGNEETLADAFATHFLTTHLPDRAVAVLTARVQSLMIEANEVSRAEWPVTGEHDNDARRAYNIAALAVAADADLYAPVAVAVAMTAKDLKRSCDYGAEIHRSWRRILAPLLMPAGLASKETRVSVDSGPMLDQIRDGGLAVELRSALERFDWHSQVSIHFADSEGGAGWSRSKRTITVNREYVERFVKQGRKVADQD